MVSKSEFPHVYQPHWWVHRRECPSFRIGKYSIHSCNTDKKLGKVRLTLCPTITKKTTSGSSSVKTSSQEPICRMDDDLVRCWTDKFKREVSCFDCFGTEPELLKRNISYCIQQATRKTADECRKTDLRPDTGPVSPAFEPFTVEGRQWTGAGNGWRRLLVCCKWKGTDLNVSLPSGDSNEPSCHGGQYPVDMEVSPRSFA